MKTILYSISMLVMTTAAFPQNCFRVFTPAFFSRPDLNGKYSLNFNYETDGNKELDTVINVALHKS